MVYDCFGDLGHPYRSRSPFPYESGDDEAEPEDTGDDEPSGGEDGGDDSEPSPGERVPQIVLAWAKRAGMKVEAAMERYEDAGKIVSAQYPKIEKDSEQWYRLQVTIFKSLMNYKAQDRVEGEATMDSVCFDCLSALAERGPLQPAAIQEALGAEHRAPIMAALTRMVVDGLLSYDASRGYGLPEGMTLDELIARADQTVRAVAEAFSDRLAEASQGMFTNRREAEDQAQKRSYFNEAAEPPVYAVWGPNPDDGEADELLGLFYDKSLAQDLKREHDADIKRQFPLVKARITVAQPGTRRTGLMRIARTTQGIRHDLGEALNDPLSLDEFWFKRKPRPVSPEVKARQERLQRMRQNARGLHYQPRRESTAEGADFEGLGKGYWYLDGKLFPLPGGDVNQHLEFLYKTAEGKGLAKKLGIAEKDLRLFVERGWGNAAEKRIVSALRSSGVIRLRVDREARATVIQAPWTDVGLRDAQKALLASKTSAKTAGTIFFESFDQEEQIETSYAPFMAANSLAKFGSKSARARAAFQYGGDDESIDEAVPGIAKWRMFAGGTAAAQGKHSYQHDTEHGEYHVSPSSYTSGKPNGYRLQFAHNGVKRSVKMPHSGLWHDLGKHSSPAAAAKAAREHHEKITEPVDEASPQTHRIVDALRKQEMTARELQNEFRLTNATAEFILKKAAQAEQEGLGQEWLIAQVRRAMMEYVPQFDLVFQDGTLVDVRGLYVNESVEDGIGSHQREIPLAVGVRVRLSSSLTNGVQSSAIGEITGKRGDLWIVTNEYGDEDEWESMDLVPETQPPVTESEAATKTRVDAVDEADALWVHYAAPRKGPHKPTGFQNYDKLMSTGPKTWTLVGASYSESSANGARSVLAKQYGVQVATVRVEGKPPKSVVKLSELGPVVGKSAPNESIEEGSEGETNDEFMHRICTSPAFGFNPDGTRIPPKRFECPGCHEHVAYWRELHADTGMDEFVLWCPDCREEFTKEEPVDEMFDPAMIGGLIAAIGVGGAVGAGVVKALRAIKELITLGKDSAAETAWNRISKDDRKTLQALAAKQRGKVRFASDESVNGSLADDFMAVDESWTCEHGLRFVEDGPWVKHWEEFHRPLRHLPVHCATEDVEALLQPYALAEAAAEPEIEATEVLRVSTRSKASTQAYPAPYDPGDYQSFAFFDDGTVVREGNREGRNVRTVVANLGREAIDKFKTAATALVREYTGPGRIGELSLVVSESIEAPLDEAKKPTPATVSSRVLNHMISTLSSFDIDPDVKQAAGDCEKFFVLTDGKRYLGIDPSGYDYPRYKTPPLDQAAFKALSLDELKRLLVAKETFPIAVLLDLETAKKRAADADPYESIEEGYQHVNWKGSKSLRFKITKPDGKQTSVQGRTFGKYIGLHMNNKVKDGEWVVTHIPTGMRIVGFFDDRPATRLAQKLEQLGDKLDFATPAEASDEAKTAILAAKKQAQSTQNDETTTSGTVGGFKSGNEDSGDEDETDAAFARGGVGGGPPLNPPKLKKKDRPHNLGREGSIKDVQAQEALEGLREAWQDERGRLFTDGELDVLWRWKSPDYKIEREAWVARHFTAVEEAHTLAAQHGLALDEVLQGIVSVAIAEDQLSEFATLARASLKLPSDTKIEPRGDGYVVQLPTEIARQVEEALLAAPVA